MNTLKHETIKLTPNIYVIISIRDGREVFAEISQLHRLNSSVAQKVYMGYVTEDEVCETTEYGIVVKCTPKPKSKSIREAALELARAHASS